MADFRVLEKADGANLLFVFEGPIDEDVQFPPMDTSKYKVLFVDLKGVTAINSVGIREWLNWIKPLTEKVQVVLMKCPKPLVFQLNMVEGFLPKNAVVKSFFVPFYCEKCDKEENILFNVGQEVQLSPGSYKLNYDLNAMKSCKEAACELEMDATEAKYFQFLKKMVGG